MARARAWPIRHSSPLRFLPMTSNLRRDQIVSKGFSLGAALSFMDTLLRPDFFDFFLFFFIVSLLFFFAIVGRCSEKDGRRCCSGFFRVYVARKGLRFFFFFTRKGLCCFRQLLHKFPRYPQKDNSFYTSTPKIICKILDVYIKVCTFLIRRENVGHMEKCVMV